MPFEDLPSTVTTIRTSPAAAAGTLAAISVSLHASTIASTWGSMPKLTWPTGNGSHAPPSPTSTEVPHRFSPAITTVAPGGASAGVTDTSRGASGFAQAAHSASKPATALLMPRGYAKMRAVSPRESTAPARRADLMAAARHIFAERGYHETTVEDITRAAGVAKGTFYLYFQEKREIFLAIIRELLDTIKAIGTSVSELGPGDDPLAFMRRSEAAALRLMEIFQDNRALARLAYRESMGMDAGLEAMIREFYRETAEIEAHNIRVAQRVGLLRPCDPLLTAYAHIGMVERVLLTMLEDPALFPEPREVIRQMMRLAYEGLRAEGAPSPF